MDTDAMSYATVNLNSFTDAPSLQPILEQPLEKKSGGALCVLLPSAPLPMSVMIRTSVSWSELPLLGALCPSLLAEWCGSLLQSTVLS